MRAYLVTSNFHVPTARYYAGTQADVTAKKKAWLAEGAKRKDLAVTEVDIPDDKQGKLDFINELMTTK